MYIASHSQIASLQILPHHMTSATVTNTQRYEFPLAYAPHQMRPSLNQLKQNIFKTISCHIKIEAAQIKIL